MIIDVIPVEGATIPFMPLLIGSVLHRVPLLLLSFTVVGVDLGRIPKRIFVEGVVGEAGVCPGRTRPRCPGAASC